MKNRLTDSSQQQKQERGSVLLEALVAIVIFSFGLLAMISMQSAAVRSTSDAKYRADASFLANQIIGQMWGMDFSTVSTFVNGTDASTAGAAACPAGGSAASNSVATTWLAAVTATLPGAVKNRQQITVDATKPNSPLVTVRVCWQDRSSSSASDYHNHVVTAQLNKNIE